MLLSRDMAEAFGDWLDLDRIRQTLLAACPGLEDSIALDDVRPLLRIGTVDGRTLVVARSAEETVGRWIVGVPGQGAPVLHEADARQEVVSTVLSSLPQAPPLPGSGPL